LVKDQYIDQFIDFAHRVGAERLVQASSGNLSWQVDPEHVLMTTSGAWLAELNHEQVAIVHQADGKVLNQKKASMESRFHLGILRTRDEINTVLHFQAPWATTLACRKSPQKVNYNITAEVPIYIGPVVEIPYFTPGSAALAEQVCRAARHHQMIVMRNHGQVTMGQNFREVLQRALFFELVCGIIIRSAGNYQSLTPEDIKDLEKYRP